MGYIAAAMIGAAAGFAVAAFFAGARSREDFEMGKSYMKQQVVTAILDRKVQAKGELHELLAEVLEDISEL